MPAKRAHPHNICPAGRKSKTPPPQKPIPDKPDATRTTDFSSLKPATFWSQP